MNHNILNSVKKLLGIDSNYTIFDMDIILHINSTVNILQQIGALSDDLSLVDENTTWDQLLLGEQKLELVKSYMYLKVKTLFDPPLSATVSDAINRNLSELEWRISIIKN